MKIDDDEKQEIESMDEEVPGILPVEPISPTQPWQSQDMETILGPQISVTRVIEVEDTQGETNRQVQKIEQAHEALASPSQPSP
eukprot:3124432-Pyramimonas_sp.AAC.1